MKYNVLTNDDKQLGTIDEVVQEFESTKEPYYTIYKGEQDASPKYLLQIVKWGHRVTKK